MVETRIRANDRQHYRSLLLWSVEGICARRCTHEPSAPSAEYRGLPFLACTALNSACTRRPYAHPTNRLSQVLGEANGQPSTAESLDTAVDFGPCFRCACTCSGRHKWCLNIKLQSQPAKRTRVALDPLWISML